LKLLPILAVFCLVPFELFAWTNGELDLDGCRPGQALAPIAEIQNDFGIKVTIETPERLQTVTQLLRKRRRAPT
jgi:hypothetical protein